MNKTKVGLLYEVTVFDKDGKKIKTVKGESKSWVRNFAVLMQAIFAAGVGNVQKENGDFAAVSNSVGQVDAEGAKVMDGTSGAASDIDAYSLGAKVGEATATVSSVYIEGSSAKFDVTGVIVHASEVTIAEIGLGLVVKEGFSGAAFTFLAARDVLPNPIPVPAGGGLTVKYTPYVTH